jgi:hypothetical protein
MPRLLAVALLATIGLAACGDDSSTPETLTGEGGGPMVQITVDDLGWSVATSGFLPNPGDVEVQLVNERDDAVELAVFPTPDGYEIGDPVPAGVDVTHEQTLAAGSDEQVTMTFDEGGDYSVLVDPPSTGGAQRLGGGITIAEG